MLHAWLVTNGFVHWDKFDELFQSFLNASQKLGIEMTHYKTTDLIQTIQGNFSGVNKPDFVLFWDKDIYLASLLEQKGLRVFNRADAIATCDNKALTCLALRKHDVKMPKTIFVPKTFESLGYQDLSFYQRAKELLGLPMVLKEVHGSFGWQVYLIENDKQAYDLFKRLSNKDLILQEFIQESRGKDIRAYVVHDRVVASMLRINDQDFRSNIASGGKALPHSLTIREEAIAIAATKATGCDFAGVDILLGKNGEPLICEVNSNAHFKGLQQCTGIDVSLEILQYIMKVV